MKRNDIDNSLVKIWAVGPGFTVLHNKYFAKHSYALYNAECSLVFHIDTVII